MTTATTDIWICRGSWGAAENALLFGRFRSNLSCAETREKDYGVEQLRNFSSPSKTRQIFLRRFGCPSQGCTPQNLARANEALAGYYG
jgi:hypothetical protein